MQLPNFFLPYEPGQDYRGFGNPRNGLCHVVVDPIALLKSEFVAVGNIGDSHVRINEQGDSQKQGNGSDGFQHGVVSPQYGDHELLRNHSDTRVMGIRLPRNYAGAPVPCPWQGARGRPPVWAGSNFLRFGVARYG
jgi:hypothetical protein